MPNESGTFEKCNVLVEIDGVERPISNKLFRGFGRLRGQGWDSG